MASEATADDTEGNLVYLLGLLAGGLILGFGIRSLYFSFGYPEDCLNCNFPKIGYSALDNIELLPAADYSIGLVIAGVLVMVALNAVAWRRTGGY